MTIQNPYTPATVFSAHTMGADFHSETIDKLGYTSVGLQFAWTGTPTGTIGVSVSNSDDYDTAIALTLDDLTPALDQPSGGDGQAWLDLTGLNAAFMWVTYDYTSGSGLFDCSVVVNK